MARKGNPYVGLESSIDNPTYAVAEAGWDLGHESRDAEVAELEDRNDNQSESIKSDEVKILALNTSVAEKDTTIAKLVEAISEVRRLLNLNEGPLNALDRQSASVMLWLVVTENTSAKHT